MDTIPAPTEQHKRTVEVPKDSAVTELFGDDTETRLVQIEEEMRREPYWFPHDQERLAKAIKAVRDGKVARDRFGIYHVTGSKPSDIYDCDKECPCPQGQKGKSKWCYHLIATVVYRKLHAELPTDPPLLFPAPKSVDERLAEPGTDAFIPEPDDIPDPPPRPATVPASVSAVPHVQYVTHAGAVMYEAPYSATVSVEDEDGYHLLLTVRKQDGKEFYKAIDGLRAWCKQHNLHPQHRRTQASGTAAPTVPASPAVPSAVEPPACLYHGTMKPSPKVPGTYFCPKKLADGTYCTERWPKKAAA